MLFQLVFGALLAMLASGAQSVSGNVSGRVTLGDYAGAAQGFNVIIGETIAANAGTPNSPAMRSRPFFKQSVTTDQAGAFLLAGLSAGHYYACVDDAQFRVVSSCSWGPATMFDVTSQTPFPTVAIQVQPAVRVSFDVADAGALARPEKAPGGMILLHDLVLGLMTRDGWLVPARCTEGQVAHYTCSLAAPPSLTHPMWVFSHSLRLSDSAGNSLSAAGVSRQLQVGAAGNSITIPISISGGR